MANVFSKGGLVISAGAVHGDLTGEYRWLATAEGGKVVKFNDELNLSGEQKETISAFVAEADKEN